MTVLIYPELSYATRGAIFDTYNPLHHLELSEAGWESALMIALAEHGVKAEHQVEFELRYKGYRIGRFFVDVVVDNKVLLELKVAQKLLPINQAQVLTYLKVTDLKLGILVNFGGETLQIERIPNFIGQHGTDQSQVQANQPTNDLLYADLTKDLRSILYEVHTELGPGLMPMHYRRATRIELNLRDIPYEVKHEITIQFHGQPIETRTAHLIIVDNRVLLAPVAVLAITPAVLSRFRQYLKLLGLKLGLIANFHAPSLEIEAVRI